MLPSATPNAVASFAGAAALLLLGIGLGSAACVTLGSAVLLGLASTMALTVALGTELRRDRLTLSLWHAHAEQAASRGATVAGVPFEVEAYLQHARARPLLVCALAPALASGVECLRGGGAAVVVPPSTRCHFRFTLSARAAGRAVVHGVSLHVPGPLDLFRAHLYFPVPVVVKVLPRATARTAPPRGGAHNVEAPVSASPLRRRGGGTDLRELRELQPGDPFKAIAWKASARAGKLMVREVESEVQETLYLVVDVSGTMRGGEPGARKLDLAIELAASFAQRALRAGDRVGLITVDGRLVGHVRPDDGLAHIAAIHDVLLGATEIVDEDLAEPDDDEVLQLVSQYLRRQDGVGVGPGGQRDTGAVLQHVARALATERDQREALATSREGRLLRRFCRARGLPLRYRSETRGFGKTTGLMRALKEAVGTTRVPRSLVVITDLDGVVDLEPLQKTLRMLHAQHHTLRFIVPDTSARKEAPDDALASGLRYAFGLAEARRLARVRGDLRRMGVAVSIASSAT